MTGISARVGFRCAAFIVAIASTIMFGAAFIPATAQDRGTGFPTGSQDTMLPDGTEIDPRKAQEEAEEAFREGLQALVDRDYDTCEKRFERVLELASESPEANYYLGVCKARLGKERRAVKYFKQAISAVPDFVEAREQLALVYVRLGDNEDAEEQLEALKTISKHCAEASCDEVILERTEKAIRKVEAALAASSEQS